MRPIRLKNSNLVWESKFDERSLFALLCPLEMCEHQRPGRLAVVLPARKRRKSVTWTKPDGFRVPGVTESRDVNSEFEIYLRWCASCRSG
jgi:hypothetical protein